jgi:hypothetical protein
VLVHNGCVKRPGFVHDGVKEHRTEFGALSYWVLKEWAGECLGRDTLEVAEFVEGTGFKALGSEPQYCLPPLTTALEVFDGECEILLEGARMDWYSFLKGISFQGPGQTGFVVSHALGTGVPYLVPLPEEDALLTCRSAYKFFSSRALFAGPGRRIAIDGFPVIQVPMEPLDYGRVSDRVVYRKSAFDGNAFIGFCLIENGFAFAWDVPNRAVFYSNSVAVGYGYPPVASAIGWRSVSLEPLPPDWSGESVSEAHPS